MQCTMVRAPLRLSLSIFNSFTKANKTLDHWNVIPTPNWKPGLILCRNIFRLKSIFGSKFILNINECVRTCRTCLLSDICKASSSWVLDEPCHPVPWQCPGHNWHALSAQVTSAGLWHGCFLLVTSVTSTCWIFAAFSQIFEDLPHGIVLQALKANENQTYQAQCSVGCQQWRINACETGHQIRLCLVWKAVECKCASLTASIRYLPAHYL